MNSNAIHNAEAILNARIEGMRQTFAADIKAGQMDAQAGIYDKWYRHHRKDDGMAYDAGWQSMKDETKNYQIIEG